MGTSCQDNTTVKIVATKKKVEANLINDILNGYNNNNTITTITTHDINTNTSHSNSNSNNNNIIIIKPRNMKLKDTNNKYY